MFCNYQTRNLKQTETNKLHISQLYYTRICRVNNVMLCCLCTYRECANMEFINNIERVDCSRKRWWENEKWSTSQIGLSSCSPRGSIFERTVPRKRVGSCGMIPRRDLKSRRPIMLMSSPSIRMRPPAGSTSRNKALIRVVCNSFTVNNKNQHSNHALIQL